MIYAYGINGNIVKVKEIFNEMTNNIELIPIKKTYAILFNSFSHCDNTENAYAIWKMDINKNDIKYDEYITSTLIDGLARKGQLMKAYKSL